MLPSKNTVRKPQESEKSSTPMRRKGEGFTLIELLVVIAIIGLLSSIVLASLDGARRNSRDAKRKSDIVQISRALRLHYDDNGSYTQPENIGADRSNSAGDDWLANSDLRDIVTDGYMPSLPVDPLNDATYYYIYEPLNTNECQGNRSGCAYTLCARLEQDNSMFCQSDLEDQL